MQIDCLYELDGISHDSEATGIVHWFCSLKCRDAFEADTPVAIGASEPPDETVQCETCGQSAIGSTEETMLSTDHRRFRKGDKVICWDKPAVIGEQYLNHGNITWLEFPNGKLDTIITHFADGQLNEHIYLEQKTEETK